MDSPSGTALPPGLEDLEVLDTIDTTVAALEPKPPSTPPPPLEEQEKDFGLVPPPPATSAPVDEIDKGSIETQPLAHSPSSGGHEKGKSMFTSGGDVVKHTPAGLQ